MEQALDKKRAEKAYQEASKQLDKEKVEKVKALVVETMRALDKAHEDRQRVVKRIQTLKRDLNDLKEGRLDRVVARHKADKDADKDSPVTPQRIQEIASWVSYPYTSNTTSVALSQVLSDQALPNWGTSCYQIQKAVQGVYSYDGKVRELYPV